MKIRVTIEVDELVEEDRFDSIVDSVDEALGKIQEAYGEVQTVDINWDKED